MVIKIWYHINFKNIHTLNLILYSWYEKNNTSGSNNTFKSKVDLLMGNTYSLRLVLFVNLRNVSVISNVHDILILLELWITITLNWATELKQKRGMNEKNNNRLGKDHKCTSRYFIIEKAQVMQLLSVVFIFMPNVWIYSTCHSSRSIWLLPQPPPELQQYCNFSIFWWDTTLCSLR